MSIFSNANVYDLATLRHNSVIMDAKYVNDTDVNPSLLDCHIFINRQDVKVLNFTFKR
jgi:hypothetical protein